MRKVPAFETKDGEVFLDLEAARLHELSVGLLPLVENCLPAAFPGGEPADNTFDAEAFTKALANKRLALQLVLSASSELEVGVM